MDCLPAPSEHLTPAELWQSDPSGFSGLSVHLRATAHSAFSGQIPFLYLEYWLKLVKGEKTKWTRSPFKEKEQF